MTNRFFLRRSAESVGGRQRAKTVAGRKREGEKTEEETTEEGDKSKTGVPKNTRVSGALTALLHQSPLTRQPYEFLSVTLRQKYFFDPNFGGALTPGRRNQFFPINTFSGFTYGGVPRR